MGLEQGAVPNGPSGERWGYLWLNERLVNWEMARQGMANRLAQAPNTQYDGYIQQAQQRAIQEALGIWRRAEDPAVRIRTIRPLSVGGIGRDLNAETVELLGLSAEEVDLSGYQLWDAARQAYTFGAVTLVGGQQLVLHSGCGSPVPERLYWCQNVAVWDARGDVAFLVDATGQTIDFFVLGN
ncbi:MAG: lamin tail domain-containing protein [Anaerolineae bacterium]|nr:lamin tail domain-containing protein [Anaerolineae bacterium]